MSDIFAELDESIKQERLAQLWADYKVVIVGFILGTILLTAAVSGYNSWSDSMKEEQTAALGVVLEAKDFPANIDLATLELRGDVRAIALMNAGAASLAAADPDLAVALEYYAAVAADGKVSDGFRDLASMMVARVSGDDVAQAQAALESVYNNEDGLWRYHAALELAVLLAHGDGVDLAKAREYLSVVVDQRMVPAGLIARAKSLDHVYAIRQAQKK